MDHAIPLAYRLRPTTIDDVVGQKDLLSVGAPLRTLIEKDALRSIILSGPPGSGKTTLASVIAAQTKSEFIALNAVTSGVKEIKEIAARVSGTQRSITGSIVLFVDEIHRFNVAQQDALLPCVEEGSIVLIGATTENPYHAVNRALVSRSQVFVLHALGADDILLILRRALHDPRGYGSAITVHPDALRRIAEASNGDARAALNLLELTVTMLGADVTAEEATKILKERRLRYDRVGDDHYDTISAFIKSLRASDQESALLWLLKMIRSGEDPRFIFRRMMIFASEDIGLADAHALSIVVSLADAFDRVGLPEGEYFLTHACMTLAHATKSRDVADAMQRTAKRIDSGESLEVPLHLRNTPLKR